MWRECDIHTHTHTHTQASLDWWVYMCTYFRITLQSVQACCQRSTFPLFLEMRQKNPNHTSRRVDVPAISNQLACWVVNTANSCTTHRIGALCRECSEFLCHTQRSCVVLCHLIKTCAHASCEWVILRCVCWCMRRHEASKCATRAVCATQHGSVLECVVMCCNVFVDACVVMIHPNAPHL